MNQQQTSELKERAGYSGKSQQWQYGFDLACRELQAELEADKWISVEDRLPRANDVVLVSFGGAIEMDFIETRLNGQIIGWRRFNQDPPTHWRPLPELPTVREGELGISEN